MSSPPFAASWVVQAGSRPSLTSVPHLAQVLSLGKTLAYTETKLIQPETGKILATGLHTKFVGRSLDSPKNCAFDELGDKVLERQA